MKRDRQSRKVLAFSVSLLLLLLIPSSGLSLSSGIPAQAASFTVTIKNNQFQNPSGGSTLSIGVGDSVEWVNEDSGSQDIAILDAPVANLSPEIKPGQSWTMTFAVAGTYHYYSEFHPEAKSEVIVGGSSASTPIDRDVRTFPETGKSVRGRFLTYWNAHGGLAQQGYPISEEMEERSDTDGKYYTVQYFERAVFEYHPENTPPNDVLLSLLGDFLYKEKYPGGAAGQQPNTSPGSILFQQTGHRLGGKFLDYWQSHGGLAQQGYPISDEFMEQSDLDGKVYRVQYFERAVFELHPENQPPYDVLLSQLGKFRYDKSVQASAPDANGIQAIGISPGPQHLPLLSGPHAAPGLNVWVYQNDPQTVITWLNDLGVKYAQHQLSWADIEPQKGVFRWEILDNAVDVLSKAGVRLVLNPVHTPLWAAGADLQQVDAAEFRQFMTTVAQRYKGKVIGYQIWNEPNLGREVGNLVIAARYAETLKAGYLGVKAGDPGAIVITGALTPTGLNNPTVAVNDLTFLQLLYAYNGGELKGYFDVLGAHPGSNANPPNTFYPDNPGPGPGWNNDASFYFRRVEQLRQIMVENGDAQKQMWLTEFGWASTPNPAPGFEYAAQTSEAEQAQYIGQAFRMGRDQYPWMGPMMLFQLNLALPNVSTNPNDERIAWGIIRRDGTERPSYNAVKQYAAEWNATNK